MKERDAIRIAVAGLAKDPAGRKLMEAAVRNGPIPTGGDKPLLFMCVPWGTQQIDECRQVNCSFCDQPVAIAPSSQEVIDAHKGLVVYGCMPCILAGKH